MMSIKKILLPVFLFLFSLQMKSTHIVGGEMNYKYLGGNNYEIRLTVYRDCWVGIPPFDNPAVMGIFDANYTFIDSVWLTFLGLDTLPPAINDPCIVPPTNFCYEVTTYIDTINLPPLTGGYYISYQRCCRNQNILNITFPECAGATYWAHIPGPEVVAVNSNPVFNNWPPPFICANKPWIFDHSATDYDGDSLAYELYTPYTGLDAACPIVTTAPLTPNATACFPVVSACPNLPVPPPFNTVNWNTGGGYGLSNVLGGIPMSIDPITGMVTATPNTLGYFVFGVKCKEYRNGVLISETLRDFQLIVLNCPSYAAAAATVPNVICGTTNVTFTNTSDISQTNTFTWNFGDPFTNGDTSHLFSPSYVYPDTGTYNYYLVAYATGFPACNDTFFSSVTFSDNFNGNYTFTTEPCLNNIFFFNGNVNSQAGLAVTYNWNFGDGTVISGVGTSTVTGSSSTSGSYENPIHTYPTGAGNYVVTLYVGIPGSVGCYDTISSQNVNIGTAGELFVPNTFTPNNDGKNDIFRVRGPAYHKFYFAVYNRWGELMFETNDPNAGWDGTFKGMSSDPGVFGWYLKASCGEGSEEVFRKGSVTLIR
jgi:gliding motility-associated-like protein